MRVPASSLQSEINVTPLVDVCLVLLIIFMVVTPVIVAGTPVQLPQTRHGAAFDPQKRQIAISVKEDGTVYIGDAVVRQETVAGELQRRHDAGQSGPVAVRADKHVPYGDVLQVLDACRAAGFNDVALVSLNERE